MRARWITIAATLALFATALFGMRFVPQQFFPASDRPELLVDLQLPENASIYATRDTSARLDKLLKDDQDVDHWSAYIGQGAVRFYLPLNVQPPNDFFAQAVVVTKGIEQRERVKAKLEKALAADFPSGEAWRRATRRPAGPVPEGRPDRRRSGWSLVARSGSRSTRIRPGFSVSARRNWLSVARIQARWGLLGRVNAAATELHLGWSVGRRDVQIPKVRFSARRRTSRSAKSSRQASAASASRSASHGGPAHDRAVEMLENLRKLP